MLKKLLVILFSLAIVGGSAAVVYGLHFINSPASVDSAEVIFEVKARRFFMKRLEV